MKCFQAVFPTPYRRKYGPYLIRFSLSEHITVKRAKYPLLGTAAASMNRYPVHLVPKTYTVVCFSWGRISDGSGYLSVHKRGSSINRHALSVVCCQRTQDVLVECRPPMIDCSLRRWLVQAGYTTSAASSRWCGFASNPQQTPTERRCFYRLIRKPGADNAQNIDNNGTTLCHHSTGILDISSRNPVKRQKIGTFCCYLGTNGTLWQVWVLVLRRTSRSMRGLSSSVGSGEGCVVKVV